MSGLILNVLMLAFGVGLGLLWHKALDAAARNKEELEKLQRRKAGAAVAAEKRKKIAAEKRAKNAANGVVSKAEAKRRAAQEKTQIASQQGQLNGAGTYQAASEPAWPFPTKGDQL